MTADAGPRAVNITRAGARRRVGSALGTTLLALTGVWMMVNAEMDRAWRVAYFPAFWLVGLCLFQVWEGT